MAYDFFGLGNSESSNTIQIEGSKVELPDASYIRDAALVREGADLILDGPQGTITVEGYFSAADAPDLVAPGGLTLTPELVNSFAKSPAQYAQSASLNDVSPVGAVDETSGDATITRTDGTVEPITIGTAIYQGDVIETSADGAVNIAFIDETSFAVSEEARLAIDEYVYDPATESGSQNFSVLKGVFVFTSGLIGRDDPDDVSIATPSGSIGIRGTIIAGNADTGEITVIEGAIVVRDNGGNEMTLAAQFETAKLDPAGGEIQNLGQLKPAEVSQRFVNVSNVSPTLFSSINDAMAEQGDDSAAPKLREEGPVDGPKQSPREKFDADGTVDRDGDSEVDGTVDDGGEAAGDGAPNVEDGTLPGEENIDGPVEEPVQPRHSNNLQHNMLGTDPLTGQTSLSGNTLSGPGSLDGNMTAAMDTLGMNGPMMNEHMNQEGENPFLDGPQGPQDPDTIIPPNGSGNPPPIFNVSGNPQFSTAPDEFFAISSNQRFEYHFDLEFFSPAGPGAILEFRLVGPTIGQLNTHFAGGQAADAGSVGPNQWFFDNNNGLLVIQAGGSVPTLNFDINVAAINLDGQVAAGEAYRLDLFASTGSVPAGDIDGTGLEILIGTPGPETITLDTLGVEASNKTIFAGDGADQLDLIQGNNNTIYLGRGNNTADIQDDGNNKVIGGFDQDEFIVTAGGNQLYGMDGDDVFRINNIGSTHDSILNTSHIDAGFDNKHSGGFGDTLIFEGTTAVIDFAGAIGPNNVRGIERIDLRSAPPQVVNLRYSDIVDMTDNHNTLIIRGNGTDSIQLDNVDSMFTGIGASATGVSVDDDYDSSVGANTNFTSYTIGDVTLLIENGVNTNAGGL